MTYVVMQGDARRPPLAPGSVDLIITSPPYWSLRSYRDGGEHYDGQIGSEPTPHDFLDALWECMASWWNVLTPGGSVFVNLGDKYAGGGGGPPGGVLKGTKADTALTDVGWYKRDLGGVLPKSLMGIPWRFAIGCIDDNDRAGGQWILRAEIVWDKPNGLPESVTDRVRRNHEQWFHFTKRGDYYSAVDEIRVPHSYDWSEGRPTPSAGARQGDDPTATVDSEIRYPHPLGALPPSVWNIPTQPLSLPAAVKDFYSLPDHFAAFPQEFPRKFVLGFSPAGICVACGKGRRPVTQFTAEYAEHRGEGTDWNRDRRGEGAGYDGNGDRRSASGPLASSREIVDYACGCKDSSAPTRPSVVLDPFGGTGTVAGVAHALGRVGVSLDLSHDYSRLAQWFLRDGKRFAKSASRTDADRQGRLL